MNDPGATGRPTFDASQQDQRGALNLVNGRVYATFAAFFAYDIGNYHGWVVSCNANNLNNQWYYSTTTNVLAGGCWGPGGAAAAPDGSLYIATGDATTADNNYWAGIPFGQNPGDIGDYFIAVVRLGVAWMGYSGRLAVLDWYQPTDTRSLNDQDLDLGSSSCLVLPDIGGMQLLVISAKDSSNSFPKARRPPSPILWWFAHPKSTRAWEPTFVYGIITLKSLRFAVTC